MAINISKKVKIKNRSNGVVGYNIAEVGDRRDIRRIFQPNEEKEISLDELEALSYTPGGTELILEYLQVSQEGLNAAGIPAEPEYFYSDNEIKELLSPTTDINKFLDALDFAPTGVIDMIKYYAVHLPCNDNAKREAIKNATGFDVTKAIANDFEAHKQDEVPPLEIKKRRSAEPLKVAAQENTDNEPKVRRVIKADK